MQRAYGNAEELRSCLPPPSQPIHHPQSGLGRDRSLIGAWDEGSRVHGRWGVWECSWDHIIGPDMAFGGSGCWWAMHVTAMLGVKARDQFFKGRGSIFFQFLHFSLILSDTVRIHECEQSLKGSIIFFNYYYYVIKLKNKALNQMTQLISPAVLSKSHKWLLVEGPCYNWTQQTATDRRMDTEGC